jgi:hypothetical protein
MGYRLKKIFARIGIFLLAFIVLGLVVRAVFNYSTGKKLEKYLAQRKSEGIPLTIRDIELECNPRDNAALDWKIAEGALSIEREHRAILAQIIDDLFLGKPLEEETKDQMRDLIIKNQEALSFILEASTKPCFKYEEQWDILGDDLRIATAIQMIQGTRLLGIDAVIKAEDGNVEEAIDQCLAARRFLKLYLQEPFLISYLVGMACTKQIAVCMNYIVSDREIETETLKKILREWDSSPWRGGLVRALESERIFGLESTLMYLRGKYDLNIGMAGDIFYWLFRPILKNEAIWMTQVYDRLLKSAKMPYYASRNSKEIEQIINSIPWYYKMAGALVPNIRATLLKRATLNAVFNSARIGIACKIYKNLHGDFPGELAELFPEILEKVPVDPFTGHPFIYKKQDSGFIVYSVGSNLKDDQGRGTWKIVSLVMEKDDDWAWKEVMIKTEK